MIHNRGVPFSVNLGSSTTVSTLDACDDLMIHHMAQTPSAPNFEPEA